MQVVVWQFEWFSFGAGSLPEVKNLPVQETEETWARSLGQEDPWRGAWQPTPVFLPGEFQWTERLVGYSA